MASTTASASAASDVATPILPATQLDDHPVGERDGQERERAGAARELEMARGQLVPRLIIGQRPGDAGGQPQPAQLVLLGERLVTERAQRDLQRRRPRNVAVVGKEGEPVEQQTAGTRSGLHVCGQNGRRDLARIASAHQPVGGKGSRERFEVRPARERRVQRLEPPGRLEQQGRSIATPRHREGDLRVQQLGTGLVELVQRPRLRDAPAAAARRRSRRPGACLLRRAAHAVPGVSDLA